MSCDFGSTGDNGNGSWAWTWTPTKAGTYTVTCTAKDPPGAIAKATFSVTVR